MHIHTRERLNYDMFSFPAAILSLILCVVVFPGCQSDGVTHRDEASEQLTEFKEKAEPTVVRTGFGEPVPSETASLTAGRRGPLLVQDSVFLDEIAHFDRERIPERVVHAKGAGAMGYFEVTHDITRYTKAVVFSHIGKRTNIAVRFSFVAGESGSADTTRDPRGFAIKFYTEDGIWDLVGNNTPVFFIRDAILFPSLIHSQKRNPVTHLKDPDMFWDFLTLRPESVHQVMILFSDRGIPDGYRHMHGFGSNTFKLVNAQGEVFWCKFHYRTNQKIKNLPPDIAEKIAGSDPDYATRDLYNAIHRGEYPSWTFYIQVMTMEQAKTFRWNPFDVTKIWPHQDFPLIPVGRVVLNKNPTNYFAEVEQIAFAPNHLIPGIEASPDKVLQGRLFSYSDTQRYRLGSNVLQLPVNCPAVRVNNEQRDGLATYFNQDGAPNYYPNSFHGPEVCPEANTEPFGIHDIVDRFESGDDDNFEQPAMFWNQVLDTGARSRMITNIANSLRLSKSFIQERAIKMFSQVDEGFGQRLKEALGTFRSNTAHF